MKPELIQPAATIAVEVLRQTQPIYGGITEAVIASAFAQAYRGLLAGMEEAGKADPPSKGSVEPFRM